MIEKLINSNKQKFNLITHLYSDVPSKVRLIVYDDRNDQKKLTTFDNSVTEPCTVHM